ncbi:unnamed protein product, partial [Arctogadus glacialis]
PQPKNQQPQHNCIRHNTTATARTQLQTPQDKCKTHNPQSTATTKLQKPQEKCKSYNIITEVSAKGCGDGNASTAIAGGLLLRTHVEEEPFKLHSNLTEGRAVPPSLRLHPKGISWQRGQMLLSVL